jgi:hypothetical protein
VSKSFREIKGHKYETSFLEPSILGMRGPLRRVLLVCGVASDGQGASSRARVLRVGDLITRAALVDDATALAAPHSISVRDCRAIASGEILILLITNTSTARVEGVLGVDALEASDTGHDGASLEAGPIASQDALSTRGETLGRLGIARGRTRRGSLAGGAWGTVAVVAVGVARAGVAVAAELSGDRAGRAASAGSRTGRAGLAGGAGSALGGAGGVGVGSARAVVARAEEGEFSRGALGSALTGAGVTSATVALRASSALGGSRGGEGIGGAVGAGGVTGVAEGTSGA